MTAAPRSILLPVLAVIGGIGTFGLMDVYMKFATLALGAYSAILWRCALAIPVAWLPWKLRGGRWPEPDILKLHLMRGLCSTGMTLLFFWGLARTPMAEAIAVSFIAPLIALFLAALILKEQVGKRAVFATLLGLCGVIVIIAGKAQGHFSDDAQWGIAAILASAVLYAINLILQRKVSQLADAFEVAFFQTATMLLMLLPAAPWLLVAPGWTELPWLAASAVLATLSLQMLSWGYARAETQVLMPVEYTAFLWAMLFGWLYFAEAVGWATLAGALLIVTGCLIGTRKAAAA